MKELKKRKWLVKNENLQGNTPKEYFKANFKEVIKEIRINETKKKTGYLANI